MNDLMGQFPSAEQSQIASLSQVVDARRIRANRRLDPKNKIAQGQFMTPRPVAQFMSSLFQSWDRDEVRLLDAGAGIGSLTAAFVEEFCNGKHSVRHIAATGYEIDPLLVEELRATFDDCAQICRNQEIAFEPKIIQRDFIEEFANPLFMQVEMSRLFTHAILNPPYKKIHSASSHRLFLRSLGIEASNLYTGFLAIAINLLEPGGELVAITPRSFCNGPYFKPFRRLLLDQMTIRHIHIFESRTHAFKEDEVLQENIILYAVKGRQRESVTISLSEDTDFTHSRSRVVAFSEIVKPDDRDLFIHITANVNEQQLVERMNALPCKLEDLSIDVSTGPVVDFRLKNYLRATPEMSTVPLIYPAHCKDNFVVWPVPNCRKPNAIVDAEPVQKWLYPNGYYILVRRFSSKEERRRIVATIHDPNDVPGQKIGFENHLNIFHQGRHGLTPEVAKGLALYLNSTFCDTCFRQFNGHTQVNVKDLYNLRYPDLATLEMLGKRVNNQVFPTQDEIDELIYTWMDKSGF